MDIDNVSNLVSNSFAKYLDQKRKRNMVYEHEFNDRNMQQTVTNIFKQEIKRTSDESYINIPIKESKEKQAREFVKSYIQNSDDFARIKVSFQNT